MDAAAADPVPSDAASAPPPVRKLSHRILRGGAWSLAGRVCSMGSLFLLNVVLARMSTNDYSAFLTAASVVTLLAMISSMGVPNTLVRVLRGQVSDVLGRRDAMRGAMTLTLVGGAVTMAVFWVGATFLPAEAKWHMLRDFPLGVGAWSALSALCIVAAYFLQAEDDFRAAALVGARSGGLISNLTALVAATAAAVAGVLTLGLVLTIQLASYVVALVAAAWYIGRLLQRTPAAGALTTDAAPAERRFTARWYFSESWPNLFNQLIAVALAEGDMLWVAYLSDEHTIANYGVIRNLRLLVTAPLMVASIALPPFIAELYARGDSKRLERLVRGASTALALPSLVALTVLLVAPAFMIRWIYGEAYVEAATALQILSLGAIVFVLTGNNGTTLTMTGRHRDLLACSVCSMAIYLAISPPLVSRYGVVGAATAFTIQTIIQNVIVTLRVKQTVGIWTIPLTSWSAMRDEARVLLGRFLPKR